MTSSGKVDSMYSSPSLQYTGLQVPTPRGAEPQDRAASL